ncbi:hypothetical protein [Clostridium sp. UBA1056]|uniref:hypothetical protein n=1 Tax=unclassified Clostridium TaxID=2614128 RepID=UPI003217067E
MKIGNYMVDMTSSHSYTEVKTSNERLKYWNGNNVTEIEGNGDIANLENLAKEKKDSLELSKKALDSPKKNAINEMDNEKVDEINNDNTVELAIFEKDKQKIRMLEEFITALTGKKFKIVIPDKLKIKKFDQVTLERFKSIQDSKNNPTAVQRQGWGLQYNFNSTYQETEKMNFKAKGLVSTEDGRTIDLDLELNMSRNFISQTNINIKAGDALIDPLVINYSGKNLELTDNKTSFDIDLDGIKDNIPFVSEGSGFLALDLNNDGVINDGKELFGPSTGNGFEELKQYDTDNNNWIDENDSIWDKLSIWTKDENGNDKLLALGMVGVGAIYVGNIDTEYSIKNSQNTALGEIKSSSIFLKEDGTAGTIHHIDLVI